MNPKVTLLSWCLSLTGCALLTQPVDLVARRGPKVTAQADRLKEHVIALAKPRSLDDLDALEATAAFIAQQLRALGYQPFDQPYEVNGRTYRNVRLVLGDPAASRLIVGAHYDSCDSLPAADDNASGVAVVLELAALLKAHPAPGTVELVFWTLEEPPIFRTSNMGSAVHAKSLTADNLRVSAALSIETVGFYSDEPNSQSFPFGALGSLYSTTGNYVALISNFDGAELVRTLKQAMQSTDRIEVHSMTAPAFVPGVDWSDHRSYWPEHIPSVMVTDTAPNRNPNYHRQTDTPDTLDYPRMAALTDALFEGVWMLTSPVQP